MSSSTANVSPYPAMDLPEIVRAIVERRTDGVRELEAFSAAHPENAEAWGHLAWVQALAGNDERAAELYRRILELDPHGAEARWRLGDRMLKLGRLEEAAAAYEQVLADDPSCLDARMGLRYVEYLERTERRLPGAELRKPPPLTERQESNRTQNTREFETRALTLQSLPPNLYIESTTRCNFFCKTCVKGYNPYVAEDLQEGVMQRIRGELMPVNTRVSITGFGEPTLASNFDELLEMSLANGSHVFFVTNASLLSFERLERLAACPVEIIVSLDGATKETFESIRAGGNFELTLEKLAMIKKVRDVLLSDFRSHFSFHFVALRQNIHELPDVVRIAHRFGLEHVGVLDYGFNNTGFDEQSLRFDPVRANSYFDEAERVAGELGIPINLPGRYETDAHPVPRTGLLKKLLAAQRIFPERNRFPRRCFSPWSEPYVHTDGRVTPCCSNNDFLGSLEHSSFREIWNGWRYRLLRLRIDSPVPPPACRSCMHPYGINGGNPGNAISREGLLVRAFYFLEWRFYRYAGALRSRMAAFRKPEPKEQKFYYRGRPMTERNRPQE